MFSLYTRWDTLIAILFLLFSAVSEARFATPNDLDIATELYNRTVHVSKNGHYTETVEQIMEVTKESGKDKLVSYPLVYNAQSSTLTLLEAKTIVKGVEYPVDLKHVEVKPLASSPKGFDQMNQMLIVFPNLDVGAKVYLKYQLAVHEVPISGFFATHALYGLDRFVKKSQVLIDSELPLLIKVHDPEHFLDVRKTEQKNRYTLAVDLKKPVLKGVLEELYPAFDDQLFPWISVSTLNDWETLGNKMSGDYEAIIKEPLPPLFETIATESAMEKTLIEKINKITVRLAEKITYMGDWRTVKGAYVPRHLNEIVTTGFGDCKDFSAATVAILRRIGINATVAIVNRGMDPELFVADLPNLSDFNHAFVMVQDKTDILWIDPTNFTSFAQGMYPDIANKNALVLEPNHSFLVKTTPVKAKDNQIILSKIITFSEKQTDTVDVSGALILKGIPTLPFVGADLQYSKKMINQGLIGALSDETRVLSSHIADYHLASRVVSDLTFQFKFTEKHTQIKTTVGNAFLLSMHSLMNKFLMKTSDRVTDLLLDEPVERHYETLLKDVKLVGSDNLHCVVNTPWFLGKRDIVNVKDGIKVTDEFMLKQNRLSNTLLKSTAYLDFQNKLFACFGDTALVYESRDKKR